MRGPGHDLPRSSLQARTMGRTGTGIDRNFFLAFTFPLIRRSFFVASRTVHLGSSTGPMVATRVLTAGPQLSRSPVFGDSPWAQIQWFSTIQAKPLSLKQFPPASAGSPRLKYEYINDVAWLTPRPSFITPEFEDLHRQPRPTSESTCNDSRRRGWGLGQLKRPDWRTPWSRLYSPVRSVRAGSNPSPV